METESKFLIKIEVVTGNQAEVEKMEKETECIKFNKKYF